MHYGVLGPLEVLGDDGSPVAVGGAKPRALLALLLVGRGRPETIDRLAHDLWDEEPPPSAAATLHSYVSRLRRVLPDGALVTEGRRYALRPGPGEVDRERFELGVEEGRGALDRGDHARAAAVLTEALNLWRGPALPELADCDRGRSEAARLEELRLTAEEDRFEAELGANRHDAVLADLEQSVADQPLRERRWGLLMRALYRAGRQAEALRRYQDLRHLLADEMGIDPGPELVRLEHAILVQDPSLDAVSAPRQRPPTRRRLPTPVTSFVGRVVEAAELSSAVRASRLVTLVGPGGVGKTRLALELARARRAQDPDDHIALIELAALTDPAALPGAIATALDADEPAEDGLVAALEEALGDDRALVVLDNCEHLIGPCAELVDEVLRGISGLHVLATSREPLGVAGEMVWRLGPMPTSDAVELFRARSPRTPGGADDDLAAVCEHLDGLPLAIELAAARLRSMSLEQLAAGLDDRFRLLGPGPRTGPARQRTLRALIEWSHDLLGPEDQQLLGVLSVFAGSFDSAAAEAVASSVEGLEPVDGVARLADLADKSLVDLEPGNRYRMLETIRQFGAEILETSGAAHAARCAHLDWFAAFSRDAASELRGTDQAEWLRRCDAEHANLRAALEWAVADEARAPTAMRMAADLYRFWVVRSHVAEGRRLLEAALEASEDDSVARAWAHLRAGTLADRQGAIAAASQHQERALALGRQLGDREVEALALDDMGTTARDSGNLDRAIELGQRAIAAARGGGAPALGVCLSNLAGTNLAMGRYGDARELYGQARPLLEQHGDLYGLSVTTSNLAVAAFQEGDMDACRRFALEARELQEQLGDRNGAAITLAALAQAEQADDNLEAAEQAATEALALMREVSAPVNVSIVLGIVAEIRVDRGRDPSDVLEEKLAWDARAGFLAGEATALVIRARHEAQVGDLPSASATIALATDRAHASGNDGVRAAALAAAGDIARNSGRHDDAREAYEEAVTMFQSLGQDVRAARALEGLAALADAAGAQARAIELRAEAARMAGGLAPA